MQRQIQIEQANGEKAQKEQVPREQDTFVDRRRAAADDLEKQLFHFKLHIDVYRDLTLEKLNFNFSYKACDKELVEINCPLEKSTREVLHAMKKKHRDAFKLNAKSTHVEDVIELLRRN